MELVIGGSVGCLVRGLDDKLSEGVALRFMLQMLAGLACMHSRRVVHRDLKSHTS